MMRPVSSSNLAGAEYDDETRTLRIAFRSGSTYAYQGVDRTVFEDLIASPSPGAYFARRIKPFYSSERVK
jgi:hypothetical protein